MRLFGTGNHVDGMTQCFFGGAQKTCGIGGGAQRGAHHPHRLRRHLPQPLSEAAQAHQGTLLRIFAEYAVGTQARTEAHRLAQQRRLP